jgi:hypothetical protein
VLFAIAMFPCAGWINWFNIPLAVVGLVISIVALTQGPASERTKPIVGLCCCAVAVLFGGIRLLLGGGCF